MLLGEDTLSASVDYWHRHEHFILYLLIRGMLLVSVIWLGYEFWRLIFQSLPHGAIDLRQRQYEVWAWMSGENIYNTLDTSVYPPASYILLWPFTGWLSTAAARGVWAATSIASLVWLIRLSVTHSNAGTRERRQFMAVLPAAVYSVGATIGNGQLGLHIAPAIIASFALFTAPRAAWRSDLLGAGLFVFALVKPSFTAPFFWVILMAPGRLRPAALVCGGYIGLSLFSSIFQDVGIIQLLKGWTENAMAGVSWGSDGGLGPGVGVQTALQQLGMSAWSSYVSLLWFFGLGIWTFVYRKVDTWILFGVAALVARFWTYHMWYDDILLIIPMIALFRLAVGGEPKEKKPKYAGALFVVLLLFSIAPGGLYLLPPPFNAIYVNVQLVIWLTVLIFLIHIAEIQRRVYNPGGRSVVVSPAALH